MKNRYNLTASQLNVILDFYEFAGHQEFKERINDNVIKTVSRVRYDMDIRYSYNMETDMIIIITSRTETAINIYIKNYRIHQLLMRQAYETASKSSCVSRQVGALIVRDDRIISEGYNDTPKGFINCCEIFEEGDPAHHEWSNIHEIHAEMNSIVWAARKGISVEDSVMYSTTKPCLQCTKNIIASGIKKIFYHVDCPRNDNEILNKFLRENDVLCRHITLEGKE